MWLCSQSPAVQDKQHLFDLRTGMPCLCVKPCFRNDYGDWRGTKGRKTRLLTVYCLLQMKTGIIRARYIWADISQVVFIKFHSLIQERVKKQKKKQHNFVRNLQLINLGFTRVHYAWARDHPRVTSGCSCASCCFLKRVVRSNVLVN